MRKHSADSCTEQKLLLCFFVAFPSAVPVLLAVLSAPTDFRAGRAEEREVVRAILEQLHVPAVRIEAKTSGGLHFFSIPFRFRKGDCCSDLVTGRTPTAFGGTASPPG